ncbi:FAD-binding protein [Rhizobium puerariae]|uniref:FAD-binding protein n=1 Tax=Rhizobium puerariae TaxID=1585791 RepID=A0ABV6AR95_9HYPH
MAVDKRAPRDADLAVSGMLSRDPHDLAEAMDDFGHIVRKRPQAVFRAASSADIAGLVQWAAARGLRIAARGQGHSVYGRAMSDGGIVLDMRPLGAVHDVRPDRMVVDAGVTWSTVLDRALAHGLTPPVLTNYLELSVGGTLAVGGIGGTTFRHGMQTDNVLALNVVTGDGRELACSAEVNSDLFDAVRAGLGQSGIITQATLRLMRAPGRVRRFHLFYANLPSLAADQRIALADGRFDHLQGAILPDGNGGWKYQLEGVVFYDGHAAPENKAVLAGLSDRRGGADISDLTYAEDVRAFSRLENLLRSNGQWFHPHPWLLTFLPGSSAEDIASDILDGLTNVDVGPFGRITFYPLLAGALRTPLLRLPDEDVVFPFNLVRIPASDDALGAGRLVAGNRLLYDRIRSAGGCLYPVSAFPMSQDDWKSHFGPKWSFLHEARRRYDPPGTLAPGYELF